MGFHSNTNPQEALNPYWQTSLLSVIGDLPVFSFCRQRAFLFLLSSDFDKFDLAEFPENSDQSIEKEYCYLHCSVLKVALVTNFKLAMPCVTRPALVWTPTFLGHTKLMWVRIWHFYWRNIGPNYATTPGNYKKWIIWYGKKNERHTLI